MPPGRTAARATTWLLDANYNRTQLRDGEGNTTAYSYEAFGNLKGSSGSTANPYRYVGGPDTPSW